jgi:hypothetical protein
MARNIRLDPAASMGFWQSPSTRRPAVGKRPENMPLPCATELRPGIAND